MQVVSILECCNAFELRRDFRRRAHWHFVHRDSHEIADAGLQLRSTMIGFFRLSYAVGGREELCLKLTQEVPVALGYFLEGPGFAQDLAQLVSTPSSCAPYPPMIEPFTRRLAQVRAKLAICDISRLANVMNSELVCFACFSSPRSPLLEPA